MKIIYFISFILLCIIIYQILNYKKTDGFTSTKTKKTTTEPMTDTPTTEESTSPTSSSVPLPPINSSKLNNSIELELLSQNHNDIINLNTQLSTIKERVNTMKHQQQAQLDNIKYLAATQSNSTTIQPLFDGPMVDDKYKSYTYKKCWSYGNIENGLNHRILDGLIYPNVKSMTDCVTKAYDQNVDSAAYDGSNLCLIGGREYSNYTQFDCSSDIYGKKAWEVYSKV
jgi:hypothetical protein